MYTVTDLGQVGWGPNPHLDETQALHPNLGLCLTDAEKAALPSVDVMAGARVPSLVSFTMWAYQNTDSGIVLGAVPSGDSRAIPWNSRELGYALLRVR
jgi:hypothetical protein